MLVHQIMVWEGGGGYLWPCAVHNQGWLVKSTLTKPRSRVYWKEPAPMESRDHRILSLDHGFILDGYSFYYGAHKISHYRFVEGIRLH